jgi:hypothetical protein
VDPGLSESQKWVKILQIEISTHVPPIIYLDCKQHDFHRRPRTKEERSIPYFPSLWGKFRFRGRDREVSRKCEEERRVPTSNGFREEGVPAVPTIKGTKETTGK